MNARRIPIFFFFFLNQYIIAFGQNLPAINITIDDDSPSNTIYDIFQDSKGYIWIGTENGLARFNGRNFKTFASNDIKSLAVSSIQEDKNGRIWMVNFSGQVLYLENDTLHSLKKWDEQGFTSFPSLTVKDDELLIAQLRKSLFKYFIYSDSLVEIDRIPTGSNFDYITVTGGKEVWKLSEKRSFEAISSDRKLSFTLPKPIRTYPTMTKLKDHYLVSQRYGSEKELYHIDFKGKVKDISDYFSESLSAMRLLIPMNDQSAAFIGLDGMIIIDSTLTDDLLLGGKNIGSFTPLNEGGFIAGTLDQGLYVVPSLKSRIFETEVDKGYHRIVYDRTYDRIIVGDLGGNIWFYSRDGVLLDSYASEDPTEVQSIYIDEKVRKLYVQGEFLLTFDLSSNTSSPEIDRSFQAAKDMVAVDDVLHLATSSGLVRKYPDKTVSNQFNGLRTSSVERLNQKELIIGSQKGIFIYNLSTNAITDTDYSFQLRIKDLTSSVKWDGKLYLATETNGLFIYEDDQLISHVSENEGLISNRVYDVDVNTNWIAVATDQGISLIDKSNGEISNIGKEKGLQSIEVTDLCLVEDELWATNLLGLQKFELPILKNETQPLLEIDQLSINGELIANQENLTIPYNFNELFITFDVADNIHAFGETKIYYRINNEKAENIWNETTLTEPTARYLSLPSGKFQIEAYAENLDGIKSAMFYLPFEVETPYWKKWWFLLTSYLTAAIIIGLLTFSYFKRANRKKQYELIRLNRLQESRIAQLTSIRAQMNPHFIFNTLSLVQGLVVQGQSKLAGKILQDFSKLMRNILDLSSREMVTLHEEIEILKKYLFIENNRLNGDLKYQINVDDEIEPELIRIPSLLTQPFVENAIRHGLMHKEGDKHLLIDFDISGQSLLIKIEDNGIGREAAEQLKKDEGKSSFAIAAYKRRIQLINEMSSNEISLMIDDLETSNKIPAGTLVTITIPLAI